jgi:hypothetical protein
VSECVSFEIRLRGNFGGSLWSRALFCELVGKVTGLVLPFVQWNGDPKAVKPSLPSPMPMPKMLTAARCSIFYDREDEVGSFEVGDDRSLRDVKAALSGLIGFAATAMAMTRELLVLFMSVRL